MGKEAGGDAEAEAGGVVVEAVVAQLEAELGEADVAGEGEDLLDVEEAERLGVVEPGIGVEELPVLAEDGGVESGEVLVEDGGKSDDLESGAGFEGVGQAMVAEVLKGNPLPVVGIEGGTVGHAEDLPGLGPHGDGVAAGGMVLPDDLVEALLEDVLDGEIDGEDDVVAVDRLLVAAPVAGDLAAAHVLLDPLLAGDAAQGGIEGALDAGDALALGVEEADQVAGVGTLRIGADVAVLDGEEGLGLELRLGPGGDVVGLEVPQLGDLVLGDVLGQELVAVVRVENLQQRSGGGADDLLDLGESDGGLEEVLAVDADVVEDLALGEDLAVDIDDVAAPRGQLDTDAMLLDGEALVHLVVDQLELDQPVGDDGEPEADADHRPERPLAEAHGVTPAAPLVLRAMAVFSIPARFPSIGMIWSSLIWTMPLPRLFSRACSSPKELSWAMLHFSWRLRFFQALSSSSWVWTSEARRRTWFFLAT